MKRRFNIQPQLNRIRVGLTGDKDRTGKNQPEVLPFEGKVKGAAGCATVDSEANLKFKIARSPALPQYQFFQSVNRAREND
jgi:hypothetical protein